MGRKRRYGLIGVVVALALLRLLATFGHSDRAARRAAVAIQQREAKEAEGHPGPVPTPPVAPDEYPPAPPLEVWFKVTAPALVIADVPK